MLFLLAIFFVWSNPLTSLCLLHLPPPSSHPPLPPQRRLQTLARYHPSIKSSPLLPPLAFYFSASCSSSAALHTPSPGHQFSSLSLTDLHIAAQDVVLQDGRRVAPLQHLSYLLRHRLPRYHRHGGGGEVHGRGVEASHALQGVSTRGECEDHLSAHRITPSPPPHPPAHPSHVRRRNHA